MAKFHRCDYNCVDAEGEPREGRRRRDGSIVCDACMQSLSAAKRKGESWQELRLRRLRTFTNRLESITPTKIFRAVMRAMPSVERRSH